MVVHHFAGGGLPVLQQGGVLGQGDDPALEEHLAGQFLLKMCCVHRFCVLSERAGACSGPDKSLVPVYGISCTIVNSKLRKS